MSVPLLLQRSPRLVPFPWLAFENRASPWRAVATNWKRISQKKKKLFEKSWLFAKTFFKWDFFASEECGHFLFHLTLFYFMSIKWKNSRNPIEMNEWMKWKMIWSTEAIAIQVSGCSKPLETQNQNFCFSKVPAHWHLEQKKYFYREGTVVRKPERAS